MSLKKVLDKKLRPVAGYAGDDPVTPAQAKMRGAHIASYTLEHINHGVDHVTNALDNPKLPNETRYDLQHGLQHLVDGKEKAEKMVENTHSDGDFATERSEGDGLKKLLKKHMK